MSKEDIINIYGVNSSFNHKCTLCNSKTKNYITFYRSSGIFLGDFMYTSKKFFKICSACFDDVDYHDVCEIYSSIGFMNKLFSAKCNMCHNRSKEYLRVEKGLGKVLCLDCIEESFEKNEIYIVVDKKQKIKNDELEEILIEISSKYRKEPIKKGEYEEEIKENGNFLLLITHGSTNIKKISSTLELNNIKYHLLSKEEYEKSIK